MELTTTNTTAQSEDRIQSLFDSTNPTDSSLDDSSQILMNEDTPTTNTTTSNIANELVNSITASTLVISKSQIIDDDLNDEESTNFEENNKNELSSSSEDENKSNPIEKNEEDEDATASTAIPAADKQEELKQTEIISNQNEINDLKTQLDKEDFNLDDEEDEKSLEHNQTLEEFVQPSTDEIATSNDNTTEEQKTEQTLKTDDQMVKSTLYSGFQYVDNPKTDDNILNSDEDKTSEHNQTTEEFVQDEMTKSTPYSNFQYVGDNSAKSEENLTTTNSNEEQKVTTEPVIVQNTSIDDENLVNDYEITKVEQFVNLDKSDLDSKTSDMIASALLTTTATNDTETIKPKERSLNDEIFESILGSDSLLKKTIQYGSEPVRPRTGQMCTISYKAFIKNSEELVEDEENLSFILGDADVMPAIDLVVCLMDKNEICEVIAEARHAYGNIGKKLSQKTPNTNTPFIEIPPNADLLYRIHLKDFVDVTDMSLMPPIERLSLAEAKKLRGNFYFNRQEYYMADSSYKKGLNYFNEENLSGDEEASDIKKFSDIRKALLMNLSLSSHKQGEYRLALNSLNQLISLQNNHVKALFIKGKCLINLGETKEAIECLTKCSELDKTNMDVKAELTKAQAKYKTQYENEKKMYQKMIGGVSPQKQERKNSVPKSSSTSKSDTSGYLNYVLAGVAVAAVSIGVTMLAKYKNMF